MSGDALAVGRKRERTYLRRLLRVLGAKGVVTLVAMPAVVLLSTDDVHPVLAGGLLAGAFGYALVVDSDSSLKDIHPETEIKLKQPKPVTERVDAVCAAFLALSLGYVALSALNLPVDWRATLVAASAVTGAVVYDYVVVDEDEGPLSVDVVGFAVAEVLLLYGIVTGTGWMGFAGSPTFGALAFLVYGGTVVAFAGHAAVTREVIVSRTDDDIHTTLYGVLGNLRAVSDEMTRAEMASEMRRAANSLDGVRLPTVIEDDRGSVPVVVSMRQPDGRLFTTDVDEVLETARDEGFTGYVVYGEDILVFRNGGLAKFYVDGEYGYDADELDDRITEATFHTLDHGTLNKLDDVTPSETTETSAEEDLPDELQEEETEAAAAATADAEAGSEGEDAVPGKLEIGGDEIDVEEMFEKADEVLEELE